MADLPAQLDYAQRPGWRQRKGLRRAVLATGLALLVLGSFKFIRPTWDHAWLLHYQGRCLNHTDTSGRTVFAGSVSTAQSDGDWERFYRLFSPPGGRHGAIVFVHELRRTDRSPRLVAIEANFPNANAPVGIIEARSIRLDSTVIVPGGALSRPHLRSNGSWLAPFDVRKIEDFRLHAGQVDPSDASHFTIAFDYANRSGTIDGWLQGDDSILLELRNPL